MIITNLRVYTTCVSRVSNVHARTGARLSCEVMLKGQSLISSAGRRKRRRPETAHKHITPNVAPYLLRFYFGKLTREPHRSQDDTHVIGVTASRRRRSVIHITVITFCHY